MLAALERLTLAMNALPVAVAGQLTARFGAALDAWSERQAASKAKEAEEASADEAIDGRDWGEVTTVDRLCAYAGLKKVVADDPDDPLTVVCETCEEYQSKAPAHLRKLHKGGRAYINAKTECLTPRKISETSSVV